MLILLGINSVDLALKILSGGVKLKCHYSMYLFPAFMKIVSGDNGKNKQKNQNE